MLLVDVVIQGWIRLETFFILLRTEFTRQQDYANLFGLLDSRSLPFKVIFLLDGLALGLVLFIPTIFTHLFKILYTNSRRHAI